MLDEEKINRLRKIFKNWWGIAMDKSGVSVVYRFEPVEKNPFDLNDVDSEKFFPVSGSDYYILPKEYHNYCEDWQDSKIRF